MLRLNSSFYTSIIFLAILGVAWVNIWLTHQREFPGNGNGGVSVASVFELRGSRNASASPESGFFFTSADWVSWLGEGFVNPAEALPEHEGTTGVAAALNEAAAGRADGEAEAVGGLPNPVQQSKFAYTTLISGLDKTYKYRGFLYNALIMRRALRRFGSTADFVAMVGLGAPADEAVFREDLDLLRRHGIIVHVLRRMVSGDNALGFAEMALLKVTPWSFLQYERVQFLDGDVMPTADMDCFFDLQRDTFTVGMVSPLNSGWFLAVPSAEAHEYLRAKAVDRLHRNWDKVQGWGDRLPGTDTERGAKAANMLTTRGGRHGVPLWDFNGADMDQGLCTQYFVLSRGRACLVDPDKAVARVYDHGYLRYPSLSAALPTRFGSEGEVVPPTVLPESEALRCCGGRSPIALFAHFTGRSKPWMNIPPVEDIQRYLQPVVISVAGPGGEMREERRMRIVPRGGLTKADSKGRQRALIGPNVLTWLQYLDELELPGGINSTTIGALGLGSPLGFFNAKFPEGGFSKSP